MSTFKKIWADAWSAKMEYIFEQYSFGAFGISGIHIARNQSNAFGQGLQKKVADNISDPSVKAFD